MQEGRIWSSGTRVDVFYLKRDIRRSGHMRLCIGNSDSLRRAAVGQKR